MVAARGPAHALSRQKGVSTRRVVPVPQIAPDPHGYAPMATLAQRPDLLDSQRLLALQRSAGNSAVGGLIRPIQRAPLAKADDPEGYTSTAGVSNVAGSGTTRREVHDLKYGLKGGFESKYHSDKQGDLASEEAAMTKETPEHMAVVVMPDKLDPKRPVQVILHFAGWGFRGGDPYAGFTVAKGYKHGGRDIKKGSVRDVDQEHWEQQIGAINKARGTGPQAVAILAQGRGMSDFGKVPTFDYVQDVLSRVAELKSVQQYSLVLSAHSGGGSTQIAAKVAGGDAETADRSKLPAAQAGQAAPQPTDLVVLFDAEGIEKVTGWATSHINALASSIKAAKKPADVPALIAASPKFRGYYAKKGFYVNRYVTQNTELCKALANVPKDWAFQDPADPKKVTVSDLFRIIEVSDTGVDHEHVISRGTAGKAEQGALADALRASQDPTFDRAQALACAAPAAPAAPKARAKTKKKSAKPPTSEKADARRGPIHLRSNGPLARPVNLTSRTDNSAVSTGWKGSNATQEYALTEQNKTALSSQTAEERTADKKALDKKAQKRLTALEKAEKKGPLDADDAKELADLRELRDRVTSAQLALKRKDVDDVLHDAGHTVSEWYGQVQRGPFLNLSLRVHNALAERLTRAETALVADPKVNPDKLGPVALGAKLKMYASTSDMRRPKAATGGTSLSMHTFGLAVDLNYKGNPFLGNAGKLAPDVVQRATSLVLGTPIDVLAKLGDAKAAYASLTQASQALQTYLSYTDSANATELTDKVSHHKPLVGEPADLPGWSKQIAKDAAALAGAGDFKSHKSAEEGFIDLDQSVVMALAGAGLTWGGTYNTAKDIMHFDLREGDGAGIHSARTAHKANK